MLEIYTIASEQLVGKHWRNGKQGIEFTLNTVNVSTKTLKWTTSFNVARNKTKYSN
jgi:hypothetical protein